MKLFSMRFACSLGRISVLCMTVAALLTAQHARSERPTAAEPPASLRAEIEKAANSSHPYMAVTLLDKTLKQYPKWRAGWWELGSLAYEQDAWLEGRMAFSTLAKLDPKAGATWVMLGLCDYELRDFGMSLLHIEKGSTLGFPRQSGLVDVARYHQALDLIVLQRFEAASYVLESMAREGHRSDALLVGMGLAALHIPAIGTLYRETADSARLELVKKVGDAQFAAANDQQAQARAIYQQLLNRSPHTAGLHYAYGVQLARWGDTRNALIQFQTELQRDPEQQDAILESAYLLYRLGRLDQALPAAQKAVQKMPLSFASHFVLGQILVEQGKLKEGAAELERSRDLQPESSQVRYALAQVYLRLHRRADALKEQQAFRRLQAKNPSTARQEGLPTAAVREANGLSRHAVPGENKP